MSAATTAPTSHVDAQGLLLPADATGVLTVSLDGQYVWSFQPVRDGVVRVVDGQRVRAVAWPPALAHLLDGGAHVLVADADGTPYVDDEVRFSGAARRVRVVDQHGHPLAVNKVGHLTRTFAATDQATRTAILSGTARILADLREHGGVEAVLNYGCLLGAVREGRMLGHDCDADLTYLSTKTHPLDVTLESYALERVMVARGWTTVRMSGGDFKVLLTLEDKRVVHVDVFASFTVGGTFYQLGNRSGTLDPSVVAPAGTLELEGVELPVPRDPEAMLAFVYGPGWKVPDPAFKFTDPPAGVRRLDGWLRGYRDDVAAWNDYYRSPRSQQVPRTGSQFAHWVHARLPAGEGIVDLGCGAGRDARYFALNGRPVIAYDSSADARQHAGRLLTKDDLDVPVRRFWANELRTVAVTALEIATAGHHVYARQLLGCLNDEGRAHLWRLARTALRDGGALFLEFSSGTGPTALDPLVRRLDTDQVVAEVAAAGGRVTHLEEGPGLDTEDRPDPRIARLVVRFDDPAPKEHHHG